MSQPPQLTEEQRNEAIRNAIEARTRRATVCRRVAEGKVSVAAVLDSGDPVIGRMKPAQLLTALPGIGKARAAKILKECRIADSRRLHGLGPNQKRALLEAVEARGIDSGRTIGREGAGASKRNSKQSEFR